MELWERLASAGSSAWNGLTETQRLIAGALIVGGGLLAWYVLFDLAKQAAKYLVLIVAFAAVVHLCFPTIFCSLPWAANIEMMCR